MENCAYLRKNPGYAPGISTYKEYFQLCNRLAQNRYSVMQIMTAKTTTLHDIVLYARHFLPVKIFPRYYFNKLCFELRATTAKCNVDR